MILCDPFAINFLATSAIKILQHLIGTEGMPRDNSVLILLLRMLALGLSAWEMIHSQEFREPRLDSQVGAVLVLWVVRVCLKMLSFCYLFSCLTVDKEIVE